MLTPGEVLCAYPRGAGSPLAATGWGLCALGPEAVLPDGGRLVPPSGDPGPVLASAGLFLVLDRALGPGSISTLSLLATGVSVMAGVELSGVHGVPTGLVTGSRLVPAAALDLSLIGLLLEVGGRQLATACGASAAGHPAAALAAAWSGGAGSGDQPSPARPAGDLHYDNDGMAAGTMIFSGRWTAPLPVPAGSHLTAAFGHLGSVSLRVEG